MNQDTRTRMIGGLVLIAILAALMVTETIDPRTGLVAILGVAAAIGLYETGKRQPQPGNDRRQ